MDYGSNHVKRIKRVYWLAFLFVIAVALTLGVLVACVPSGGEDSAAERPTPLPPCVNNPLAGGETELSAGRRRRRVSA